MPAEVFEEPIGWRTEDAGDDCGKRNAEIAFNDAFEAGLSVVVEAMPTCAFVIDKTCRVVASNDPSRSMLGELQDVKSRMLIEKSIAEVCV